MRRHAGAVCAALLALLLGISGAWAGSIDQQLENLKSQDPKIRAEAAYELGCG